MRAYETERAVEVGLHRCDLVVTCRRSIAECESRALTVAAGLPRTRLVGSLRQYGVMSATTTNRQR